MHVCEYFCTPANNRNIMDPPSHGRGGWFEPSIAHSDKALFRRRIARARRRAEKGAGLLYTVSTCSSTPRRAQPVGVFEEALPPARVPRASAELGLDLRVGSAPQAERPPDDGIADDQARDERRDPRRTLGPERLLARRPRPQRRCRASGRLSRTGASDAARSPRSAPSWAQSSLIGPTHRSL